MKSVDKPLPHSKANPLSGLRQSATRVVKGNQSKTIVKILTTNIPENCDHIALSALLHFSLQPLYFSLTVGFPTLTN